VLRRFTPSNPENTRAVLVRGRPSGDGQPLRLIHRQKVSPDYFRVMGIGLLEGSLFNASDQLEETYVVDELFAERFLDPGPRVGAEVVMNSRPPPSAVPWTV
jgi:hypothetical protein